MPRVFISHSGEISMDWSTVRGETLRLAKNLHQMVAAAFDMTFGKNAFHVFFDRVERNE